MRPPRSPTTTQCGGDTSPCATSTLAGLPAKCMRDAESTCTPCTTALSARNEIAACPAPIVKFLATWISAPVRLTIVTTASRSVSATVIEFEYSSLVWTVMLTAWPATTGPSAQVGSGRMAESTLESPPGRTTTDTDCGAGSPAILTTTCAGPLAVLSEIEVENSTNREPGRMLGRSAALMTAALPRVGDTVTGIASFAIAFPYASKHVILNETVSPASAVRLTVSKTVVAAEAAAWVVATANDASSVISPTLLVYRTYNM